jgi:hypothetical protein
VARDVYLVGSVPMASARDVFCEACATLGPRLRWLPDGETGERLDWVAGMEAIFASDPALMPSGRAFKLHASAPPRTRYALRPGKTVQDLRFSDLGYARHARESYAVFKALKADGRIPARVKFQVDLVPAHSVLWLFLEDDLHAAVDPIYNAAVMRELDAICADIPHDQLAVQYDVASAVFARLERNEASSYGQTKEQMQDAFSRILIDFGNRVPPDVDLLFHLCYGDSGHKHVVEPTDMADMVEFSNRISAGIHRRIDLIHMPVPRDRDDAAYFEPLRGLRLRHGTEICLGLVHYTDGVAGTGRRMERARAVLPDFLIGTECGFGRRPAETIPDLMRIHAEVAEMPN